MVKRGVLGEPKTPAHLAKLKPVKVGGKMNVEAALADPAKAKYMGLCCGGTRIWGEFDAAVYKDACGFSLPARSLLALLPHSILAPYTTRLPLGLSRATSLICACRNRNDYAVFVCGGCKEPLPLPLPAGTAMTIAQPPFASPVPMVAQSLVIEQDFSENYAVSPHAADVQTTYCAQARSEPDQWHMRKSSVSKPEQAHSNHRPR